MVSSESKKLIIQVLPNSTSYGPGESAIVNISTTDVGGNPVSADVALWAVDKAIFELSDNKLGDIERFKGQRSESILNRMAKR